MTEIANLMEWLIDPMNQQVQEIRFWLAVLNIAWLFPLGVMAIVAPGRTNFPNAALAIPLTGIMLGLAGFSAAVAFDFHPTTNWGTLLSLLISGSLVLLFFMGVARWLGVEL